MNNGKIELKGRTNLEHIDLQNRCVSRIAEAT